MFRNILLKFFFFKVTRKNILNPRELSEIKRNHRTSDGILQDWNCLKRDDKFFNLETSHIYLRKLQILQLRVCYRSFLIQFAVNGKWLRTKFIRTETNLNFIQSVIRKTNIRCVQYNCVPSPASGKKRIFHRSRLLETAFPWNISQKPNQHYMLNSKNNFINDLSCSWIAVKSRENLSSMIKQKT